MKSKSTIDESTEQLDEAIKCQKASRVTRPEPSDREIAGILEEVTTGACDIHSALERAAVRHAVSGGYVVDRNNPYFQVWLSTLTDKVEAGDVAIEDALWAATQMAYRYPRPRDMPSGYDSEESSETAKHSVPALILGIVTKGFIYFCIVVAGLTLLLSLLKGCDAFLQAISFDLWK
jgi:hypothetical protein